jgi:hypothetical protein
VGEHRTRRRHLQDGVVAALDVLEDERQGAAGSAPPAAAPGGIVACRRRGRTVVRRQLAFVPTTEERGPRLPIVGVERGSARCSSVIVSMTSSMVESRAAPVGGGGIRMPPELRRHPPGERKSGGPM